MKNMKSNISILMLSIAFYFQIVYGQQSSMNEALFNYLNSFKLTSDIELAKNTPEDRLLHFITPAIVNFKNEFLDKSYFIIAKDSSTFVGSSISIDTLNELNQCNSTSSLNQNECLLISYDVEEFNFNKERLFLFGESAADSVELNLIESLSNFKYDLKNRFTSNIVRINILHYWLLNINQFNDYKHDIDLNVYVVFKFKSTSALYYSQYVCNFYPHSYWDADYLLYDKENNFISGLYPIVYRNDVIFNLNASSNKTDKTSLVYGLNRTSIKVTFNLKNDYNLCNINYFEISYSNDYDNGLYSKHYNHPNIYNDSSMLIDICSSNYQFNYAYFSRACNGLKGVINKQKPKLCSMTSDLTCYLNVQMNIYECSLILNNFTFASKFRIYMKAISKINQDIWSVKGASVYTDITVPTLPIQVKINMVKIIDQDIPIINVIVPEFTQLNGQITKIYVFLINHGQYKDSSFMLLKDMYPRIFDPKNQNDIRDFISNVNKEPSCDFNSELNEPCRLDYNNYARNKNYLLTNLVTDQIRNDFSKSMITQCSFIQKNSTYQLMFFFQIDYLVGKYNTYEGTTTVDYSNSIYFASEPLEPLNPSQYVNNINILKNTRIDLSKNINSNNEIKNKKNDSSSSVAALATFMTFSLIANIGLVIFIFRHQIKDQLTHVL